ncbi:YegS/Rv2252/BmrU family lipid kinase [Lachnospiraceae bacterium 62-35]
MKKLLFIVNPCSGKGKIRSKMLEILDLFCHAGYETTVYITQKPLEAAEIAGKKGKKADLIVCSGGDGTLNETVSGMMRLKTPPPLGYIPAGSTNDYAASLEIPKQMLQAAKSAVLGECRLLDVGKFCSEKYFVYIAGFGAFTEVSYITPQDKKNLLGHQAYMIEAVKRLTALKSIHMNVEWETEEGETEKVEGDFIFGMITNTVSVGGFKGLIRENVKLNDGLFECLFIRMPKTPLEFSNIVSYLLLRDEKENELVRAFRSGRIRIHSEEPVDWVLDGEFGGTKVDVIIENLQEKLKIRRIPLKKR